MKKSKSILGIILAVMLALGVLGVTSGFTYAPDTQQSAITASQIEQTPQQPDDGIMSLGFPFGPDISHGILPGGLEVHQPRDGDFFAQGDFNYQFFQNNELMATVYLNIYVHDVAKGKDGNGNDVSYFDVKTKATVAPNGKFYFTSLEMSISCEETIVDATYLSSNVTKNISLSGSVSTNGDSFSGSIGAGVSYSYQTDGKNVEQNFSDPNNKVWKAKPIKIKKDTNPCILEPSVRIKTAKNMTRISVRVENATVKKKELFTDHEYRVAPVTLDIYVYQSREFSYCGVGA